MRIVFVAAGARPLAPICAKLLEEYFLCQKANLRVFTDSNVGESGESIASRFGSSRKTEAPVSLYVLKLVDPADMFSPRTLCAAILSGLRFSRLRLCRPSRFNVRQRQERRGLRENSVFCCVGVAGLVGVVVQHGQHVLFGHVLYLSCSRRHITFHVACCGSCHVILQRSSTCLRLSLVSFFA